jgi:hypothetical protein
LVSPLCSEAKSIDFADEDVPVDVDEVRELEMSQKIWVKEIEGTNAAERIRVGLRSLLWVSQT